MSGLVQPVLELCITKATQTPTHHLLLLGLKRGASCFSLRAYPRCLSLWLSLLSPRSSRAKVSSRTITGSLLDSVMGRLGSSETANSPPMSSTRPLALSAWPSSTRESTPPGWTSCSSASPSRASASSLSSCRPPARASSRW